MTARRFELHRDVDETGVSGTGVVAAGVLFPLTTEEVAAGLDPEKAPVALRWLTAWPTSVVFHERGMESVEAIHGHDGKTRIVWCDRPDGYDLNYEGAMADLDELVRLARALVDGRRSVDDSTPFTNLANHLDLNYPERT